MTATLEILIPTYRRPESAIEAIASCLRVASNNVRVLCHSNGREPLIEEFCAQHGNRCCYGYFSEDMGAKANFSWLLSNFTADYGLFLSDEDRLDAEGFPDFLEFLGVNDGVAAFVCSVYDSAHGSWFYHRPDLHGLPLAINSFVAHRMPAPWYLSGYAFRREYLSEGSIGDALKEHPGNVFPHLDLLLLLLGQGRVVSHYSRSFVVKGEDVLFGGDAYSHLRFPAVRESVTPKLNPEVYGPLAIVRTYYYRKGVMHNLGAHPLSRWLMALLSLRTCLYMLDSCSEWVATTDADIREAVRAGTVEQAGLGALPGLFLRRYASTPGRLRVLMRKLVSAACHILTAALTSWRTPSGRVLLSPERG